MVSFLSNKRQWTIAVIVGSLMLLLPLCAVLLVLPALTTAQCEPQLTVQDVLTQDAGGAEQTTFAPGETIRFVAEVNNAYGGWMLGSNGTELAITTSFYSAANPVDIPPGVSTWTWEAAAPSTAGDYTVEVRVYDHFCGISGGLGTSFIVGEPEETPPPEADPTIALDPTEGAPGTEVTVQGSGWIAGDTIFIHFAISGNEVAQATVDNEGNFVTTFTVPADAAIGEQKVFAITADGYWQTDAIFHVTEPDRLRVITALSMPTTSLFVGEDATASFTVKNVGGSALHLEELAAGGRRGSDWNGEWADFPHVLNITLQPNEEYVYNQSRSFDTAGEYFAEPVVKINGKWGGIENSNRVSFTIVEKVVVFLNGIRSFSSTGDPRVKKDFEKVESQLKERGVSQFVYFSYSAAAHNQVGESYCSGWAQACGPALTSLSAIPVYESKDTKLKIDLQVHALDWLLLQIVKQKPHAQIELVGFSLGAIVASYWASGDWQPGTHSAFKRHKDKIHSLVLIESPVGGFPLANAILGGCPGLDGKVPCEILRGLLTGWYGEDVLRQLQLPIDERTRKESIIDSLRAKVAQGEIPVTSIQSSIDYLVNNQSIPLCYVPEPVGCKQKDDEVLVGEGSQSWPSHTLYNKEPLGGGGLAAKPFFIGDIFGATNAICRLINENHEGWDPKKPNGGQILCESLLFFPEGQGPSRLAPLKHEKTAQWVKEAVFPVTK